MRKYAIALITIILFTVCSFGVSANSDINIVVNGQRIEFNDDTGYPYVDENDRTMVPLRATMESAGFAVGYDENAQTAIIIAEHKRIEVPIWTNKVYVNNELKENDTIAVVKNGRTYLPIRIIFEAEQYTVEWDPNTNTVNAYNYDYNEAEFVPFHTSSMSVLIDKLLSGDVVYINGQYYATPEYMKMASNVQMYYSGDDLNTAIYPEKSRFDTANIVFPSSENKTNSTEWIAEYNLVEYNDTLTFEMYSDGDKVVPALIKRSKLTGTVDKYLLTDLPTDFAKNGYNEGVYNEIKIKAENGTYYFWYEDLKKLGIIW